MAWLTGPKTARRPLAITVRANAEADATARITRTPSRNRSDRCLVKNRRRLHRRALNTSRLARRRALRPGPPTRVALRARTNLQVRNPAETKTTLWRENHPRRPFPRRLKILRKISARNVSKHYGGGKYFVLTAVIVPGSTPAFCRLKMSNSMDFLRAFSRSLGVRWIVIALKLSSRILNASRTSCVDTVRP